MTPSFLVTLFISEIANWSSSTCSITSNAQTKSNISAWNGKSVIEPFIICNPVLSEANSQQSLSYSIDVTSPKLDKY